MSGYYASPWPGEDGGPERLARPRGPFALDVPAGARLVATRRPVFCGTMTVLRDPGEVYFLHHQLIRSYLLGRPTTACVERIDPVTLEPVARSPRLAGGRAWPGGVAVHANGDLYVVYGRHAHRLAPDCSLRASLELPADRPYNSFVILDCGVLVTKDFADEGTSSLSAIDPETLRPVGPPTACPEPTIARLSSTGNTVYVVGVRSIFRYHYREGERRLDFDASWRFDYASGTSQSYGWDVVLDGENAWFMDNGRHRYLRSMRGAGVARTPNRLLRVSLADAADHEAVVISGLPGGSITNPPLVDLTATRRIVVAYDSANSHLRAFRIGPAGRAGSALSPLWERPGFACASHLVALPEAGLLVANDFRREAEHLVFLDLETGAERARARVGFVHQGVVFPSVGWDHDVYFTTFSWLSRVRLA